MGYLFSKSQIENNLEISIIFYEAHINVLGKRERHNWVLVAKGLSKVYEAEGTKKSLRLQEELRKEFRKKEVFSDISMIATLMIKITLISTSLKLLSYLISLDLMSTFSSQKYFAIAVTIPLVLCVFPIAIFLVFRLLPINVITITYAVKGFMERQEIMDSGICFGNERSRSDQECKIEYFGDIWLFPGWRQIHNFLIAKSKKIWY